jgi:hypothetical protein
MRPPTAFKRFDTQLKADGKGKHTRCAPDLPGWGHSRAIAPQGWGNCLTAMQPRSRVSTEGCHGRETADFAAV